ncbi:MAG: ATP-binding protein [Bacteroidetes bacterium]|nr:ATP-binding protein [Bacteroidota bacterium]
MKITIDNLGKIVHGEIELNDLTVLVGDNNSGKTYVTYTIYGLLKNWTDFVNYNSFDSIEKRLRIEGQIVLEKEEVLSVLGSSVISDSQQFQRRIRELFNDKERILSTAQVKVVFENPVTFKDAVKKISVGDTIFLKGEMSANRLTISYTKQNDRDIDGKLFRKIVGDLFSSLVLDDIFPDPIIITAERLGISLFYKELDEKRNSLIEGLQKLDESDGNMHPFELIMSMSAYYAMPIRDHIGFTRNLDNIKKNSSSVDASYAIDIVRSILGAEFKKENKQDIRFYTKNKRANKFDIPLYLASSSARCIVDIYFYLKHLAKVGDVLIIDEPESHLTLGNQRLMAKLIAAIINLGVKVFITTHSDFLVKELNNLILLSNDFEGKLDWLKKNRSYYLASDCIAYNRVSVYQAKAGYLDRLNVTRKGMEIPFFDDEINKIFSVASDLDYMID